MPAKTALWPKELQREYDWAFAHYHELAKRYPNQWVAFANLQVVAAGPNLRQVLDEAHHQLDWSHIPHLFVEAGIHVYAHCP